MSGGLIRTGYFSITDTSTQFFETTNFVIVVGIDITFVATGPVNGPLAAAVEYQIQVQDGSGVTLWQHVGFVNHISSVIMLAVMPTRLVGINAGLKVVVTRLSGGVNSGYYNGSIHYERSSI